MNKRLGRGLESLISKLPESTNVSTGITTVKLEYIKPNKYQPRKEFEPEKLQELANSIKENGIIQPIIVTKNHGEDGYELVAGERRLEASKLAGMREVPVIVRSISDKEKLLFAIIENVQRENLNALEEAKGYNQLKEEFDMSTTEVAELMGKDRTTIVNFLRLLKLVPEVQQLLLQHKISAGHSRALLKLSEEKQLEIANRIVAEKLSVRATENLVKQISEGISGTDLPIKKKVRRKDLESQIKSVFKVKVKVEEKDTGKGKITLSYRDSSELDLLLSKLLKED